MKALVLGGSGHLGNAITRALINRGYEVTAAGRRIALPINLVGLAIKYVPGDIDSPGQIDGWVEGHDVVVDAAAPYPSLLMPTGDSAAVSIEQAGRRTRMLGDFQDRARPRLRGRSINRNRRVLRCARLQFVCFYANDFLKADQDL